MLGKLRPGPRQRAASALRVLSAQAEVEVEVEVGVDQTAKNGKWVQRWGGVSSASAWLYALTWGS